MVIDSTAVLQTRIILKTVDSKQLTVVSMGRTGGVPEVSHHIILKLTHVLGQGKKGSCSLPALHLPKILASNRKW